MAHTPQFITATRVGHNVWLIRVAIFHKIRYFATSANGQLCAKVANCVSHGSSNKLLQIWAVITLVYSRLTKQAEKKYKKKLAESRQNSTEPASTHCCGMPLTKCICPHITESFAHVVKSIVTKTRRFCISI